RLRTAGIENLNVDLIVGLPRQTRESWRQSVDVAIASGVPHISVYMLEVDEDSRLGREVLAAGKREEGTGNRLRCPRTMQSRSGMRRDANGWRLRASSSMRFPISRERDPNRGTTYAIGGA